jgi:hypothetical protein
LKAKHVIRKVNGTWAMCAEYSQQGFAKYKTFPYTDSQGKQKTSHHLYFTEAGREFLRTFVSKKKHIVNRKKN